MRQEMLWNQAHIFNDKYNRILIIYLINTDNSFDTEIEFS